MDKEEIFELINNNIGKFFVQKSLHTFLPFALSFSVQFRAEAWKTLRDKLSFVNFGLNFCVGNHWSFHLGFDDEFWREFHFATDTSQNHEFQKFLWKCVPNEAPQVPVI